MLLGRREIVAAVPNPRAQQDPSYPWGRIAQRLEVHASQAQGPTLAELEAPRPLREARLHTRPQRILLFQLCGPLSLSRGLDRLVVGVTLLKRSVAVRIQPEWATPLDAAESLRCA